MEFITKEETIHCIRVGKNSNLGIENRTIVASFDARINRAAPHVVTKLLPTEIEELELWLKDRRDLQARLEGQAIENTILEALPILLRQAIYAVKYIDKLDSHVYFSIVENLKELSGVLENCTQYNADCRADLKQMKNSEEQKERLSMIKKNIEKK
ncbi:hypothetical protein [Aliamphritea hakodatensis]|uniref:hypothetical protein n=1 Tax=Aliamphritea hakodatensis TaxID=2895352 RepID=UPI0022FD4F09|nr:hypothetical protein [Aliamphritea hakodatensis]